MILEQMAFFDGLQEDAQVRRLLDVCSGRIPFWWQIWRGIHTGLARQGSGSPGNFLLVLIRNSKDVGVPGRKNVWLHEEFDSFCFFNRTTNDGPVLENPSAKEVPDCPNNPQATEDGNGDVGQKKNDNRMHSRFEILSLSRTKLDWKKFYSRR